jgi:hypothetical protein
MKVHAEMLRASLEARLLSVDETSTRTGIPKQTLYGLLGRASRRDAQGYVDIEPTTARGLARLLEEVQPVLTVNVAPQGPPARRQVPVDQTHLPGDLQARLDARAQRREQDSR